MHSAPFTKMVEVVSIALAAIGVPVLYADETSEERVSEIYFKRIAVAPFLVGHRQPNLDESLDDTLRISHRHALFGRSQRPKHSLSARKAQTLRRTRHHGR